MLHLNLKLTCCFQQLMIDNNMFQTFQKNSGGRVSEKMEHLEG
jgi:trimethylamine:corrinoid methyltransferase-like protein